MIQNPAAPVAAEQTVVGVVDYFTLPLAPEAAYFNPLVGRGPSIMDEPELMCFLRAVCPDM